MPSPLFHTFYYNKNSSNVQNASLIQSPRLLPQLQEEIISKLWNLPLTTRERKHIISSVILINKHWKSVFLKCAFRDIHFTSEGHYQWYQNITKNGYFTFLDCTAQCPEDCQSITLNASDALINKNTVMFSWIDWNIFPAQYFQNIHRISVNNVDIQCLGLEGRWGWVKNIPEQVNILELGVVAKNVAVEYDACKPVESNIDSWIDCWETDVNNTSITHLYIWGLDVNEIVWNLFGLLFPNLTTIFSNGSCVIRSSKPQAMTLDEFNETPIEYVTLILTSQMISTSMNVAHCGLDSCPLMGCVVSQITICIWEWIDAFKDSNEDANLKNYFDSVSDFLSSEPDFYDVTTSIWKILKQDGIPLTNIERLSSSFSVPSGRSLRKEPKTFATELYSRFWGKFGKFLY
ncbi:hypothetical protein BDQ17DRAFT_1431945 [Cyathus striatus]|nr:hypothetical protein BDQ17DRAFT_1431945 [Cyathus striatus]